MSTINGLFMKQWVKKKKKKKNNKKKEERYAPVSEETPMTCPPVVVIR